MDAWLSRLRALGVSLVLALSVSSSCHADDGAKTLANNAWMMTSAGLVLFMTAPGLAMFYGGLVRKKNVLGVMMQCIFLMGMMTAAWGIFGYSWAFGGSHPYWGNGEYLFLKGVKLVQGQAPQTVLTDLPDLTFMVFQGMFFIITPALICGAFAERMKFSSMAVFLLFWGTLVYCPLCHWVWDGGILAFGQPHAIAGGALDFAGGTVVHVSSGFSALVCALVMGERLGYGQIDMRPHNLSYTVVGAAMLWVGWFGFNAGSAGAASDLAASALVATHFSAAAGAISWAMMEWLTRGKPGVLGTASGAVAGLVCITPASGYVQPMPALVMGALAGICCYLACSYLKAWLKYDDSLDAFGVHGVGGALGAILTGVFATTDVKPDAANGLFYDASSGARLLVGQFAAVAVTMVYSVVVTFLLLQLINFTIGLRITKDGEVAGLDLAEHGEEGYIFT